MTSEIWATWFDCPGYSGCYHRQDSPASEGERLTGIRNVVFSCRGADAVARFYVDFLGYRVIRTAGHR